MNEVSHTITNITHDTIDESAENDDNSENNADKDLWKNPHNMTTGTN